jgi:RNA-directed DNA polymerase
MAADKAGALVNYTENWKAIDWHKADCEVRRLQMRIAKAVKEGRHNKACALQWILSHSFYAKALAVKRVSSNRGKKTSGVDGVLWKNAEDKMRAVLSLRQHGYKAQPLNRIYIPKKKGKRPLSIPTMYDRAIQALYKLALAPIAETTAEKNSYGFREGRSCADAIAAAFNALSKPTSATWILEGDIKGCFDNISHQWIMDNIPMEKKILKQWLKAGYMEKGIIYPTQKGTPQGGIASPTISNMTLDGLEKVVHDAVHRRSKVNYIRYADDFIITGKSKTLLETKVKPAVEKFLEERGLSLSQEKTKITYIRKGFTFLGQTFRKHGKILHITPSNEAFNSLIQKVGTIIRKNRGAPMEAMIKELNSTLRGWANYHRHVVSSKAFRRVDTYVYNQLWRLIRRRHRNKSAGWLYKKYWTASGKDWIFSVRNKHRDRVKIYEVIRVSSIGIKRHIKIRADANPYMPEYSSYFWKRRHFKECRLM